MERDEIIRMALEACAPNQTFNSDEEWVERFAVLVAEHWIETNKALVKEIIEMKKQAEQEPVGVVEGNGEWGIAGVLVAGIPIGTKLYTHPVRTKDLTDDEINELWLTHGQGQMMYIHEKFARAVIAAYKEKNK